MPLLLVVLCLPRIQRLSLGAAFEVTGNSSDHILLAGLVCWCGLVLGTVSNQQVF